MPKPSDARNPTSDGSGALVAYPEHMNIIRELMTTLKAVSYAGQHHVMNKTLGILRSDIARADLSATDPRAITIANALRVMEQEAGQLLPSANTFDDRATLVLDVLLKVWCERLLHERID